MLFDVPKLKSLFELEYELENDYANLNAVASEIYRITNLLYDFYKNKEVVRFYHKASNGTAIFVDFHNVHEKTWFRTIAEIKEILYRPKVNDQFQIQFSLNKVLIDFGIKEPNDEENYKRYLQLLYLFYMINYFAFPQKNIFKILKKENMSYLTTYDEGVEQGVYLSFIMSNVLNNKELDKFIYKTNMISDILNEISIRILNQKYCEDYQVVFANFEKMIAQSISKIKFNSVSSNGVIETLIDYFQNYAMCSYSTDLLLNLTKEKDLFKFEKIEIPPPKAWKSKYIALEELDAFLYTDELIMFCKQSIKKVEYRNKIKFNNSNAVRFLKKLIVYDEEWIADFDEDNEGLLIEIKSGKLFLYALKIAVVIKTYNDLINKLQIKISSKNNKRFQPLRSVLSAKWNSTEIFPPTLGIRFFMLGVHAQYLNVIREEYYLDFINQYLFPEILNMRVFSSAYEFNSYKETKQFLNIFLEML